jgi:uncharacterized protein (TIGR03083 family)
MNEMDDELVDLVLGVLAADHATPPSALRDSVLEAARRRRPSGRWCGAIEPLRPMEAFRRATERLARLLGERSASDWDAPARGDWTVKDLVAHLIGADEYTRAIFGLSRHSLADSTPTHLRATEPTILELARAAPDAVVHRWTTGVDGLLAQASVLDARRAEIVDFYGLRLPIADVLTVRAFEVWAHSEDIAAALACPIEPPEPARLALMTELAVGLLPFALRLTQQSLPPGNARLVLTGPGGGTWDVPLTATSAPAPPDVVVVLDTVEYCRHAARGHLQPEAVDTVEGDRSLVPALLAAAAAFAE